MMNNHSELVREKLIEELENLPTSTRGALQPYIIADFILARDKKNASPIIDLPTGYKDESHRADVLQERIDIVLKNLGA